MKRHSGTMAVIASALMLPAGLYAADSEPTAKSTSESKPAADAQDSADKARDADKKVEAAKAEPKCEYVTGSRIRHHPPVKCEDGTPGLRVITADDLQTTGEVDITEALRKLDPRMR